MGCGLVIGWLVDAHGLSSIDTAVLIGVIAIVVFTWKKLDGLAEEKKDRQRRAERIAGKWK